MRAGAAGRFGSESPHWDHFLDRAQMVQDYLGGMSSREVGTKHRCSMQSVLRELRRRGEDVRDSSSNRKYDLDEHFFDVIDTEEKAYWLGFLTADGYVHEPYFVSTRLKRSDKGHLMLLKEAVKSEAPIYDGMATLKGRKYPYSGLDLNSVILVQALVALGVMRAKSKKVKPCASVPEHLLGHYWRGVFDGDGCISPSAKGFAVSLASGSRALADGFVDFVRLRTGYDLGLYDNRPGVLVAQCGGKSSPLTVLSLLYRGATICLPRKRALAASAGVREE